MQLRDTKKGGRDRAARLCSFVLQSGCASQCLRFEHGCTQHTADNAQLTVHSAHYTVDTVLLQIYTTVTVGTAKLHINREYSEQPKLKTNLNQGIGLQNCFKTRALSSWKRGSCCIGWRVGIFLSDNLKILDTYFEPKFAQIYSEISPVSLEFYNAAKNNTREFSATSISLQQIYWDLGEETQRAHWPPFGPTSVF